jgi:ubiquinone/menaquinone biosynthesis C-methylase UbiE
VKVDSFPPYRGVEWDRKINNPNHPNFWKYNVADRVFLDRIKSGGLILDLGCGTGGSALFLSEHGKAEWIVAVDLVCDMVKVGKRNAVNRRLDQKVSFLVCDGRFLPFKTRCFEALVSRGDSFCFLLPLKNTIQELRRVIKPKGVVLLEVDNRVDWKPGTIISSGFQKTIDGKITYLVQSFSTKRNLLTISYVLDFNGKIAKKIGRDALFKEKGYKTSKYSLKKIKRETAEIRRGVSTHWPTPRELCLLFKRGGFAKVEVTGNGLLMKLLLDDDRRIVEIMKKHQELFFEIEKRLVPYINPNKAPTIIMRATRF